METAKKEDISKSMKDFFAMYFKQYVEVISKNESFIGKLKKISYPEIDSIFIFKFVRIELDHLKSLDQSIVDKEVRATFSRAILTASFLSKFKKEYISAHIIFSNHFTEFNEEAKSINERFERAKQIKNINSMKGERLTGELEILKNSVSPEDVKRHKEINTVLADTLQKVEDARNDLEEIIIEKKDFEKRCLSPFLDMYKSTCDKVVSELIQQIATFSFDIDRDIWVNVSRSKKIINFFQRIGEKEHMNIQKYMQFHLDHQTSAESKGKDMVIFRKKLTDSINKIKAFNTKEKAKESKTS